ncbi:MAG: glycosyltransferase [Actinomycetota bacterium]|nr:glycosyltransferase [Actinomycetota bacterium]
MRFSVVGPAHPYKGGPAQHATGLAHHLADAGHDVALESWSAQYPKLLYPGQLTVDTPEMPLFPVTRHTLSWRRPDGWLRHGRRIGRASDAVVLFVYSPVQVPAYLGLLTGLRRSDARVIGLCNNVLPHERRAIDIRLMGTLLDRLDGLLVHSAQQAELAATMTGAPSFVAALPPHLPDNKPGAATSDSDRPASRSLLFFGMVRPYKGLDVLLQALASGPEDVRLVVAGEFWGGTEDTEKLIADLGLADRVELRPGYVASGDMPALFGAADALVLPYRSATASQNAMIAFEYGLPVIATRAGALADPVRDGVDGIVCEPADVDSLVQALGRFYAPGEPERLRGGVRPLDPGPAWRDYVTALEQAAAVPRRR